MRCPGSIAIFLTNSPTWRALPERPDRQSLEVFAEVDLTIFSATLRHCLRIKICASQRLLYCGLESSAIVLVCDQVSFVIVNIWALAVLTPIERL